MTDNHAGCGQDPGRTLLRFYIARTGYHRIVCLDPEAAACRRRITFAEGRTALRRFMHPRR